MNIKNTNLEIKQGAYFITYCPSGDSFGERVLILTYSPKEVMKKYKKAGYYLFGSPTIFLNGSFFLLTKSLKHKTRNKRQITLSNEMYHVEKYASDGQLKTEL